MKPEAAEGGDRERVSLDGLFAAAGWLSLLLGVVSVVGQRIWPIELITHFWPQLAVTLFCSSLVAGFFGSRRRAAILGIGALALATLVASALRFAPSSSTPPELVVMFSNVERSNREFSRLIERVRAESPDILALVEVDEAWLAALEDLRADYPHQVTVPRNDNFGIALLSRVPVSAGSAELIGPSGLPSIFATIESDSGPLRVVVTHPIPPFNAFAFDSRNQQLAALSEEIVATSLPTLVLGDLNSTPWSPFLREFRRTARLESASSGLRALYTWPTDMPLLALELDHCLYSGAGRSAEVRVLGSIGSDHFPILCSLGRSE